MSAHSTSTHVRPANTAAWRAGTFVRRFRQTHEQVYTRMPSCAAGGPYPGVGLDGLLLVTPKHSGVLSLKQTGAEHSAQKHGGSSGHAPRDSCAVTKSTPARRTALHGRAALMSTPVHRKPRSSRSRSCARAPQPVARVHRSQSLSGAARPRATPRGPAARTGETLPFSTAAAGHSSPVSLKRTLGPGSIPCGHATHCHHRVRTQLRSHDDAKWVASTKRHMNPPPLQ